MDESVHSFAEQYRRWIADGFMGSFYRQGCPAKSLQVSAGLAREMLAGKVLVTLEGYYKSSSNILGYKPGASFLLLDDPTDARNFTWQDNVTAGKGTSYGMELLLHKNRTDQRMGGLYAFVDPTPV